MDGQTLTADSLIAPHLPEVATANRVDNAQSYPKSQDSVALRIVTPVRIHCRLQVGKDSVGLVVDMRISKLFTARSLSNRCCVLCVLLFHTFFKTKFSDF